jgi:hypothetical protein
VVCALDNKLSVEFEEWRVQFMDKEKTVKYKSKKFAV